MSSAICDLAKSLKKDDAIEFIIPSIISILKDSVTEVRVSLLENLHKLSEAIGNEEVEKHIIPEISKLSKDNTWRVRLAAI